MGANDATNTSPQTDGTAAWGDVTDWLAFDTPMRGWGPGGATVFPATQDRDACRDGETCALWDWSLTNTDTVLRAVNPQPDSESFFVQPWVADDAAACAHVEGAVWDGTASTCTTTFMLDAVEVAFDHVGNDNALCESGETCVFAPNIGAYQGHGALSEVALIGTGGTLENIRLLGYASNGY